MSLTILNDTAYFGLSVPLPEFPALLQKHLELVQQTLAIEELGCELTRTDFAVDLVPGFVEAVCKWGGYSGIAGRVLKDNPIKHLQSSFKSATESLVAGDVAKALIHVNSIHGLGTPSFGSKHLRFLRPDLCPVFDSLLRDALPYPFSPDGYAEFSRDCVVLGRALAERKVSNPRHRPAGAWFAADVEGALFIRRTRPKPN
jgi:hypothetical protein